MLLHEKMRLQRKINKLTLKQLHMGNIQDRMQKKVDKREKYYARLEKQLERQANSYVNLANNSIFSNGMGNFNPGSVLATGAVGYSPYQEQAIRQAAKQAGIEGKEDLVALYLNNSIAFSAQKGDDNKVTGYEVQGREGQPALEVSEMQQIQQAAQYSRYFESQFNQMQTAARNQYQEQVNEWKQAMLDQLDMQKEWEMDLLAEEQSDIEAEKTSIEAQLQMAKDRKEAIEQELGNSIKDSAPKFGLG